MRWTMRPNGTGVANTLQGFRKRWAARRSKSLATRPEGEATRRTMPAQARTRLWKSMRRGK